MPSRKSISIWASSPPTGRNKLLTDILDLCMLEDGRLEIRREAFVLKDVLASLQGMFHYELKQKNLNYEHTCPANIPEVLAGDKIRLTQVLLNLVGNAIKFTNAGQISFDV